MRGNRFAPCEVNEAVALAAFAFPQPCTSRLNIPSVSRRN
jgi:hypothetical protein